MLVTDILSFNGLMHVAVDAFQPAALIEQVERGWVPLLPSCPVAPFSPFFREGFSLKVNQPKKYTSTR